MRDGGTLAEIRASEAADACFRRIEHVKAEKLLLEFVEPGLGNDDVRRDAAATGDLAGAVSKLDLGWMIGNFALVVVLIERDGFVIALNQSAARSVVAGGGEREARVFAERLYGLYEPLTERSLTDDEAAIVILHRAGNNFRGRGGVVIHQDDERNRDALIAADGVIAMVLRSAAVMRNDELIFFKEHVADCNRFVEKTAWIAPHVENEAVEIGGVKFL